MRPVLGRPPVDGTEEDIDAWVDQFVDKVIESSVEGDGPDDRGPGDPPPSAKTDEGAKQ